MKKAHTNAQNESLSNKNVYAVCFSKHDIGFNMDVKPVTLIPHSSIYTSPAATIFNKILISNSNNLTVY